METYFDILSIDLTAYLQLFIESNELNNWCQIIHYCNDKKYWEYFYSFLIKEWRYIIDGKPKRLSFSKQYKELLNITSDPINIFKMICHGRLDKLAYLNNYGKLYINETIFYKRNRYLLEVAINDGSLKIIKYLIEHGANVNQKYYYQDTALILAIKKYNLDIINILLSLEKPNIVDINLQDRQGVTPLNIAIKYNHIDIIELLIKHRVNINYFPKFGNYPIIEAIMSNNLEIIKLLVKNGADLNIKDTSNRSPLEVAKELNSTMERIKILIKNKSNLDNENSLNSNSLDYSNIVEYLENQK